MNYDNALNLILQKQSLGIKPGLTRIYELLNKMDNPQDKINIIHIAGTNGKGTTAAALSNALIKSGKKVGLYTSPWTEDYREQIKINGNMITEEEFASYVEKYIDCDATEFELVTAIMYKYFADENVDFAVVECGMGGKGDATNVEKKNISIITSVAIDHTAFLGSTLEEIAAEKAGILKKGTHAVLGIMDEKAADVIKKQAEILDVPITNVDNLLTKISTYEIPLNGVFQRANATLAVGVVETLFNNHCGYLGDNFLSKKEEIIRQGLAEAKWPGRMEVLSEKPYVLVDGAHNPQGVEALFNSLKNMFPDEKFVFLVGVMADKDYRAMMRTMYPLADTFLCATVDTSRSLQADELCQNLLEDGMSAVVSGDLLDGIQKAIALGEEKGERIIIFGSLYFIGEVKAMFEGGSIHLPEHE